MPNDNKRSAIVALNTTPQTQGLHQKTFVCLGVVRGGTSAVAGLLQRLGVFMGHELGNNYEDKRFLHATIPDMKAAIQERNAEHDIWGWKNPQVANHLDHLMPHLRNPHLIVVYRDLVATMRAHARWHDRSHVRAAQDILLMHHRNWFLVERAECPILMVSYEKLALAPALFVQQMASFLGVPRPKGRALGELVEFLAPGSYK